MKFTLIASALSLATSALAATPYSGVLTSAQAKEIVLGFKSVLQNQTYNGMDPNATTFKYLSPDYVEVSDSILMLQSKNNTIGDGAKPAAASRAQWYAGVSQHPISKIVDHDILVAGKNKILWYWTFSNVGINKYPIKGFNLFRIDCELQIYEVDIEFNNIAWGIDIFELQQYCTP